MIMRVGRNREKKGDEVRWREVAENGHSQSWRVMDSHGDYIEITGNILVKDGRAHGFTM